MRNLFVIVRELKHRVFTTTVRVVMFLHRLGGKERGNKKKKNRVINLERVFRKGAAEKKQGRRDELKTAL